MPVFTFWSFLFLSSSFWVCLWLLVATFFSWLLWRLSDRFNISVIIVVASTDCIFFSFSLRFFFPVVDMITISYLVVKLKTWAWGYNVLKRWITHQPCVLAGLLWKCSCRGKVGFYFLGWVETQVSHLASIDTWGVRSLFLCRGVGILASHLVSTNTSKAEGRHYGFPHDLSYILSLVLSGDELTEFPSCHLWHCHHDDGNGGLLIVF